MSAADGIRDRTKRSSVNSPAEIESLKESIVSMVAAAADLGKYGAEMELVEPVENQGLMADVVGDLRGGGFGVDILAVRRDKRASYYEVIITW